MKNVGEPCAGKSHARFDAAAGGNQASRLDRTAPAPPVDPTTPGTGHGGGGATLTLIVRKVVVYPSEDLTTMATVCGPGA